MIVPRQDSDAQQQNREAKTHEVKTSQSFRECFLDDLSRSSTIIPLRSSKRRNPRWRSGKSNTSQIRGEAMAANNKIQIRCEQQTLSTILSADSIQINPSCSSKRRIHDCKIHCNHEAKLAIRKARE